MFEKEALDKSVREQLKRVPEDHTIAVVAVANNKGAKIVTAVKIADEWELQGYAQIQKDHGFEYGASVQWSR